MSTHQPRSQGPHHHEHVHGTADSGRSDDAFSLDAIDLAACRLNLTSDGRYLDVVDPEPIAATRAAGRAPVVAVAIVLHHNDSHEAARTAADVLRSAIWSHLDSDDLRVEVTVVSPSAGRDG